MKLPSPQQKAKGKGTRVVLPVEEIFDVMLRVHRTAGHKRRDIMMSDCSKQYAYITTTLINSKSSSSFL